MNSLEKGAEGMITVFPAIFKKFRRVYQSADMPRQQMELLFKVGKFSGQPVSYYSELMMLPKSNITVASNKLVEEGLIERLYSESDRRLIILKITEKGETYLKIYKKQVKDAMIERLQEYSDAELDRMADLLEELNLLLGKEKA